MSQVRWSWGWRLAADIDKRFDETRRSDNQGDGAQEKAARREWWRGAIKRAREEPLTVDQTSFNTN